MKILLFIDSLGSGGAQRQMVELANGFKEKKHDVSFLTYHNLNFFQSQLVDIEVHTIIEPNYLKRIFKIRRYIRNNNFNVVISFLSGPCFISSISALPFKKWKLIVGERSSNPNILSSFKGKFVRFFHIFADEVVSNSYTNMKMILKANSLLDKKKCRVIHNIIDLNKWILDDNYEPLVNGKLKVLIASSHQKLKNLDGLIEGVNRLLPSEKERIEIDWFGEVLDESYEQGREKIQRYALDKIFSFYKPTDCLQHKMRNYDVVALFSFYEGLPNAICEGMGSGKIVIASDVSDNSSILNSNEFIIDPKKPESIMKIFQKLIKTDKEYFIKIGNKNRKLAEKLFNREKILNEYLDLMK